ncbi:MAG: peptidoglycan-binding domain-containing protein [Chthoniobacterales bacterium]
MRAPSLLIAVFCCVGVVTARADQTVASVQQALKDQGFYYGEITGTKDADTTAAIRRYQIRNGLKVTGEMTPETEKSLGVRGGEMQPAATPSQTQRSAQPRSTPALDPADLRDNQASPPRSQATAPRPPELAPDTGYAPGPHGLYPATSGVFDGTPFEVAPIEVQRQAVVGAQSRLAQQGYYTSGVDGAFGPGTAAALRTFQVRFGLAPSGRLDMETLAALGLLPGQRAPGVETPRRRIYRSPRVLPGLSERVYIPR